MFQILVYVLCKNCNPPPEKGRPVVPSNPSVKIESLFLENLIGGSISQQKGGGYNMQWKKYEICSKLTIRTPERHHWLRYGVFIVNFEHVSLYFSVSVVDFKRTIRWVLARWNYLFPVPIFQKIRFSFFQPTLQCHEKCFESLFLTL